MGGRALTPRPSLWHALLLLPLAAVFAAIAWQGNALRDDPAEVLRHLRAREGPTLPAAEAAGLGARSELESYDRETLFDYIDGAAEAYLARGFERCSAATFTARREDGTEVEVAAEAYRFATSAGAREQLEAERPGAARPPASLPEAFTDGGVLLLVEGRDLLKLTALARGADATPELLRIAVAWRQERRG